MLWSSPLEILANRHVGVLFLHSQTHLNDAKKPKILIGAASNFTI